MNGVSLLAVVRRIHPDLVVQDMSMPSLGGVELIREVRRIDSALRIIRRDHVGGSRPGSWPAVPGGRASAYVLKELRGQSELLEAVRCAMEHKTYVTPLIAGGIIGASRPARPVRRPITNSPPGSATSCVCWRQGKSHEEAAAALSLTARTVAFHKYRMMAAAAHQEQRGAGSVRRAEAHRLSRALRTLSDVDAQLGERIASATR